MSRSLTPQNPSTTNTISVSSSAGFSAGDLVYQKSGSVNPIPDGTASSANFNVTSTVRNSGLGPTTAQLLSVNGIIGGGVGCAYPNAAKLTNGNMVVVYCSTYSATYYFRIIDENGTEVVAETSLGATSYNQVYGTVCVTALTGGGFAVALFNSSANLAYAVYSNTGTVVTSLTADATTFTTNGGWLSIASRPDGSFIILMNDSSTTNTRFKVYSSTGTQVIAWTNVVAYYTIASRCSVAVRSDNSFVVSTWTSSTNIQYYVYSSAGATSTNASLTSGTGNPDSTYLRLDSTALTNDTVIFSYNDVSANLNIKSLNTSNVLSNLGAYATAYASNVKALSSGGFIISYANSVYNFYQYLIRNSSGGAVGSGSFYGVGAYVGRANTNYSVVEMASNIAVINSSGSSGSSTYGNSNFMSMLQIVTATSAVRNFSTTSMTTGLVSSSVNAYARGGSTPNAAAFLASTSTTLTKSISQLSSSVSSYVVSPTLVDSAACNFVFVRVMQNGQIVVVYTTTGSTQYVKMAIYSPAGVYQTTYTISTSYTNSIAKCCVLTNGNLVVTYSTTSATLTFAIYSPSFVLLSTATQSDVIVGVTYGHDISPMTNGRFVLGYYNNSAGTPTWAVYNSSASQLATGTISSTYNQGIAVGGTANGGFVVNGFYSAGNNIVYWYVNTTGTTFVANNNTTYSGSAGPAGAPSISVSPNGQVYTYNAANGSATIGYIVDNAVTYGVGPANGTAGAVQNFASTVMPDGSFVVVMLDNSTYYGWCQLSPIISLPNGTAERIVTSSINMTGAIPYTSTANSCTSVAALYDNQFVVVYRDTSTYPRIFIGATTSGSYSTTTVAGTTVSNPAYYPSQSNGYIFKGVALTSATAGGSGVVQNVGAAQLNSQYPSSTTYQAFDSTGTLVQGTKGTITGRNVNMTGTS